MIDHAELRERAERAPEGEWSLAPEGTYPEDEGCKVLGPHLHNSLGHLVRYYVAQFLRPETAAYIVAAQPQVVLALLDRIEKLEEALRATRGSSTVEYHDDGRVASVGYDSTSLRPLMLLLDKALSGEKQP